MGQFSHNMKFTKEQRNGAYKKLSPKAQDFIMENETTDLIENYLKESGLSEEQSNLADSEILYAMLGLQPLIDAISNIAKLSNKNINDFSKLKIDLENNIFSKIQADENKKSWSDGLPEDQKTEIGKIFKNSLKEKDFQKTLSQISQYKNAPQKMQEFVLGGVWTKRVGEIATKYSLTEDQTIILQNLTLSVIVGIEEKETLNKSLETELGISELLAGQILADLDTRVFQYATDFISHSADVAEPLKPSSAEVAPTGAAGQTQKNTFDILNKQKEEVEIPPVILPMVESERPAAEVAGARPATTRDFIPQTPAKTVNAPSNLPGAPIGDGTNGKWNEVAKGSAEREGNIGSGTATTQEGTFIGAEFVQKPIAVPRFSAVVPPPATPTSTPPTNQTTPPSSPAPVAKPEIQNPPRYTVDPYREPIE